MDHLNVLNNSQKAKIEQGVGTDEVAMLKTF